MQNQIIYFHNSGRIYSEQGQRVAWTIDDGGDCIFADLDRNICGVIERFEGNDAFKNDMLPLLGRDAELRFGKLMCLYDRNLYDGGQERAARFEKMARKMAGDVTFKKVPNHVIWNQFERWQDWTPASR